MSSEPIPIKPRQSNESVIRRLRDNEHIFELLVDSVTDYGIFMLDPCGNVITWNEGAEKINGYTANEVIGKHVSILYAEKPDSSEHAQNELEIANTKGRFEEHCWLTRSDGSQFCAHIVITPAYENEELVGFAVVCRDLTDRQKLEPIRANTMPKEQHLRLMINSVRDYAIFMLDSQGNVMTWNEGAQRIKGYAASEIIGKHFSHFYTQDAKDSQHPQKELEIAKKQGRYEEEGWRVRKDGTTFWANVVITALFDHGKLIGFAKVTRDLTERRRLEEQKEENARQIEETNAELQRMAYVVSHELQAPISTISRYGNLFAVRYRDALGTDAHEFIDKMIDSTKLISRMIDDLWTYARVSRPNAIHELVYARHCLNQALSELDGTLGDAEIHCGELPSLEANRAQLSFIFKELINNAIRFRSADVVRIEIKAQPVQDGWLFSVKDNGIGLDKIHSSEVFQLFHRLRGGPEPTATGMGLSICRKIVNLHRGHIWFESAPGDGTTFFFWLPQKGTEKLQSPTVAN